jgi:integrase
MGKNRKHGEGNIDQLSSGHYRGRHTVDGRRVYYTSKSLSEVKSWLRKTAEQIDQGMTYQAAKITLEQYLDNWLAGKKTSTRPTTYSHYASICNKYLKPAFGRMRVKDITADKIKYVYNKWQNEGVGAYTIRKAHNVLHNALEEAECTGMVMRNVCDHAKPPKEPDNEVKPWTADQANQFLTTAKGHRLYALFYLALATGMRQMELLGLQWTDLDRGRGILHVQRQLSRSGGQELPLKTKNAKRSIELGTGSLQVLEDHYQKQLKEQGEAGTHWHDTGLMFTSTIGTSLIYKNMMDRDFKPLIAAAKVPAIRFHTLRHTAASLLICNKVPIFFVSKLLGHARESITSGIYGHLIPGAMVGIGDMMDELIAPISINISQ